MNQSELSPIELFFQDPRAHHTTPMTPIRYGTLHLLRRDIITCSGKDPETGEESPIFALWPQAMAVLAGIDLLGKFYCGSDSTKPGDIGNRFKGFIVGNSNISREEAEIIWQLRNSLLHSFGLYSKGQKGKIYRFTVTNTGGKLISYGENDQYIVDLQTLNSLFEEAVDKYRKNLLENLSLQKKFNIIFEDYGAVYFGPVQNV
jgi:hypothetical protein